MEVCVHHRATILNEKLNLKPHPEGGHFAEVYRSSSTVQAADDRGERSAVTTIYFLLLEGELSRWHQVRSDELWHHYEGAPLELQLIDPQTWESKCLLLGPEGSGGDAVQVIPGGYWQAARTTGEYTLVGCTVAPGFEYDDYNLFLEDSDEAEEIRRRFPELTDFI
jgi:predicted cupin superfamily sugar epimerase